MKRTYKIFILGCLALMASEVKAQDKKDLFNPVNYAVISQTIAPDARGGGLGDVGVATDPDVNSQYWNPAKYPFTISRAGVSLSFTPWLRSLVNDMNLAYLSGYYRIGDYSAVSASLRYFNMGEVFTSQEGAESGTGMSINPYEMSVDVAYSLMLSEKFSLAAAIARHLDAIEIYAGAQRGAAIGGEVPAYGIAARGRYTAFGMAPVLSAR